MRSRGDDGAAVVEFVLVGSLITLMFLAVVQVAIDYHIRNVLAACAAEGARYAADADVDDARAGADKTNALITQSLGSRFAHAEPMATSGTPTMVAVRVHERLPLLAWFLPVGPTVDVVGHAVVEGR